MLFRSQAGISGATATSWNALAAPAKTPRDVIARLSKAVADALNSPDLKTKLAELNVDAKPSTPDALASLLASDTRRWSDVIIRAKIEKQ